jgi:opine dehydrogenase
MATEPIAVVGGSNGGYAAAADLADRGFAVRWYVHTPANHEAVLDDGRVTLRVSGHYRGRRTPGAARTVEVGTVTADLGAAVSGAGTVLVPLPTTTHDEVLPALAPVLSDGQTVLLAPGNCGSLLLRSALSDRPTPPAVTVAETPTLPYVTRRSGPAEATINLDAVRLPVGAFPGADTDRALRTATALYPEAATAAADALDAALNNSNACVNATPTVLNAGAIESPEVESFNVHRQGVGEAVYRAIRAVDGDRVRLRRELGYGAPHFTQDEYYEPGPETGEHFYGADARAALTAADTFSEDPPSLDDRYLHEDVAVAAVLLSSVGDAVGVDTPTVDALVRMAEALADRPYRETGRTVERLGLGGLDRTGIAAVLERGFGAA